MTAAPVMSITDELVAELAHEFGVMNNPAKYNDKAVRVARTVLAIIAERAELKRDAERYRWLRGRLVGSSFDWDDDGMVILAFEIPDNVAVSASCDKVIDAAMQS